MMDAPYLKNSGFHLIYHFCQEMKESFGSGIDGFLMSATCGFWREFLAPKHARSPPILPPPQL